MSTTLSLQLEHKLPSDFESIYTALLDFKKFGELHEYITEVELLSDNSPECMEYKVYEEIYLFGFLKNNPIYAVKVYELAKHKHIRYVSQVKKNIELVIDLEFSKPTKKSVLVKETFQVRANVILGKVFLRILKKAHLKFFANLRNYLRTGIEEEHN